MDLNLNWGLIAPVIVLQLLLVITALISLVRAESVRGSKWIWALIIIFGTIAGSIVYFLIGRKEA
ncbi:Negative regulatory protein YxlE [compost metagenome]|uniref:Phospholipase_D-nuclease N-terminal n=2 Tax=Fontibacillus TaxID=995014 RepID=A0A1G7UM32_9BACL|nr:MULTISPECIES: PLDc N-terminal domain-containing protein [Fontibacillus]MBA9084783.1 formate hydrogenlyase subunit 3/multisubunit Na+/H+ antiporter MnhD subunit [Fontibacillus solani]SDG47770.1 Phospholipase_D-nuclease N-terminal [Fontibacillus panacisegetis]